MPDPIRVFMPWGDYAQDLGEFGHDRLTRCENVAPAFGNFYPLPNSFPGSGTFNEQPGGLHVHTQWGFDHVVYVGTGGGAGTDRLYEVSSDGSTVTNRTRAVGGDYTSTEWGFTSFGQTIIACDYNDAVQHITAGAANFADGITSTFKPRARYPFVVKGNVFLAHCNIPVAYDTLGTGNNPYLVCWSKTDAPAIYGSPAVDPQHVGAGFQQLANDLGYITAVQGGEYGLVFQEKGIVRIDGPPYTFRIIGNNLTTRFPYSVVKVDEDVYFWSKSGPAVLRGGEGPGVPIGDGRVSRTLIDNFSGFSSNTIYAGASSPTGRQGITAAYCPRLSSIFFGGLSITDSGLSGPLYLIYNIREDRFSFYRPFPAGNTKLYFLRQRPESFGASNEWLPTDSLVVVYDDTSFRYLGSFFFDSGVASLSYTFRRAYAQFEKDRVACVLRVRPVHRLSPDASALTLTATLDSVNSPSGTPTTKTSTTLDAHGWLTFTDSIAADFNRIQISYAFADDASPNLMEAHGVEVEYVAGGSYGA